MSPSLPRQFLVRAVAIIAGLTMLLVVNVRGAAFYVAWTLIVVAFLTEVAATVVYWRRSRGRTTARPPRR
jgi:membrane protein implicated in regulation of membrane protease activity